MSQTATAATPYHFPSRREEIQAKLGKMTYAKADAEKSITSSVKSLAALKPGTEQHERILAVVWSCAWAVEEAERELAELSAAIVRADEIFKKAAAQEEAKHD